MNKLGNTLLEKTPDNWVINVLENFNEFLLDHASCEKKAASLALSFVVKYPDRMELIDPMIALAREELDHFRQVFKLILKRKLVLPEKDEKDLYINLILEKLRHGRQERLLDRLLVSGLIEARGHERFTILAAHLKDPELQKFYSKLANREAGHCRIFMRLAKKYFSQEEITSAMIYLQKIESQAMLEVPFTHRLH